ncbi:MAG: hypothetical protein M3N57_02765 [Actinomycetota bacterium]|nr:hypothetical protein [Actinomycetota bacterium]
MPRWLIPLSVVVVAGVLAVVVARAGGDAPPAAPSPSPTAPAAAPTETAPAAAPTGFVRFQDEQTGIAISYPANWERLESPDPQVVVVATLNGRDSFLVRRSELGFTVTAENLDAVRSLTAEIVTANEDVELLAGPEPIELAGLPGHFYLYTFADESGQRGAHSHYFVFRGDIMISLVFQALPADRFAELAPTFDAIAASIEVTAPQE